MLLAVEVVDDSIAQDAACECIRGCLGIPKERKIEELRGQLDRDEGEGKRGPGSCRNRASFSALW